VTADAFGLLDEKQVDARFDARPTLRPLFLSECIRELVYWHELSCLRSASGDCGDSGAEAYAREGYAFRQLALIRARTPDEALAVFQYMLKFDCMDRAETNDILMNLIGGTDVRQEGAC
jgi:hypothetical protein